jgi:hypothetical protein
MTLIVGHLYLNTSFNEIHFVYRVLYSLCVLRPLLCAVFRLIFVLFCVMRVICVVCLIVLPLPPAKPPFVVKINKKYIIIN